MIKSFVIALICAVGVVANAAAHTFFIGATEISANQYTNSIEVIHRFTSHDLEAMLSDKYQQRIDADSEEYLKLVQDYVEQRFSLTDVNGQRLTIEFIGVEAGINATHIYQEVVGKKTIKGLTIYHQLLTDYFPKQKNRLNFESKAIKGSLLFDDKTKRALMK